MAWMVGHHADRDGGGGFALIAWATGNVNFANYLHIPTCPAVRAGDRLYRHCGRGPGFPLVQHLPGPGLHGDVGSLALGGALGTIAVLVRQEFLLVIMGASS